MTDVQRPPTLTLRSRTGPAKPTLWPTLNPCHFTVPCFIFKTKTFSFSSKQAFSNNVFGVKIGRTTTLRRLFKVINFRRSKFVCTLWPCPVFGMCAAGLATHLTTPVCPVARTQTIILQVVYSVWGPEVNRPMSENDERPLVGKPTTSAFKQDRPWPAGDYHSNTATDQNSHPGNLPSQPRIVPPPAAMHRVQCWIDVLREGSKKKFETSSSTCLL